MKCNFLTVRARVFCGAAAVVAAALAFCAVVFSCDMGGSNDAVLALAAMGQGVQSGSAGTGEIKWAGSQTLSGSIAQEGIFPAEFCVAQDVGGVTKDVSKTIFPTAPTTGLTYSVTASATISGTAASATGEVDASVSPPTYKIDLPYATGGTTWSVTVSATSGGKVVLTKTQDVPVNSSASTTKAFKLEYSTDPTDGTGSVSLKISYASTDVSAVNVYWNNSDDADERASDEGWVIYSNSGLAPGSYDIKIVFTKGGAAVYAIKEKVNVYANLISNMIVGNADYISSGKINVTSDCISAMGSVADGGIWLGGKEIVDSSVAANDSNSGTKFKPVATLYRAFQIVNSLAAVDSSKTYTINVQGNVDAGTSSNKTAALNASAKVLLKGTNSSTYWTISGGTTAGTYKISSSSSSLTCNYLTFDKLGGFTVAAGKTTANYCKVTNGTSSTKAVGGGFTVSSGATLESTASLTISGCTNSHSSAGGGGGGIYCNGTLSLKGTTISACKATGISGASYYGCGGGIFVASSGQVTLDGCTIGTVTSDNTAASSDDACSNRAVKDGGGIYINTTKTVTIKGSTKVSYNFSGNGGGGIALEAGTLSVTASDIIKNGAKGAYTIYAYGGGIYYNGGTLTLASTANVSYNKVFGALGVGGGLSIRDTVTTDTVLAGTFYGNASESVNGGAIHNYASATITLGSNLIVGASGKGNTAKYGAGVYNCGSNNLVISGAKIEYNTAEDYGGGIYNSSHGLLTFSSGSVSYNEVTGTSSSSTYGGAGIYNNGSDTISSKLIIKGTATISGNKTTGAVSYGGGILNSYYSKVYVSGSAKILENSTLSTGGGIYSKSGELYLGYSYDSDTDTAVEASWTGSIAGNTASNFGGGIHAIDTLFNMKSGTIGGASATSANKAQRGAGIYIYNQSNADAAINIEGGTIQYNEASESGGGIFVTGGQKTTATITATISNNSATERGGGIYNYSKLTIRKVTLKDNTAKKGGGIYYSGETGKTSLTIDGYCTFGTSTASQDIYFPNANSAIEINDNSGKLGSSPYIVLTPDQAGGCTIGTTLISTTMPDSTKINANFVLPPSMTDVYGIALISSVGKLDLKPVSQVSITGKTVSANVGTGAFKSAATTPVTVKSIKMSQYEVTYDLWYAVYQWAIHRATNPYTFGSCGKEFDSSTTEVTGGVPSTSSVPPTTETVLGEGRGGQRPVNYVSWRDAVVWCNAYSEYKGLTPVYYTNSTYTQVLRSCNDDKTWTTDSTGWNAKGGQDNPYIKASTNGNINMTNCTADGARLPTEAEWEFAARGGNPTATVWSYDYTVKSAVADLPLVAWFKDNSDSTMHVVGQKQKNSINLFDMLGNSSEWCHDWVEETGVSTPTRREKGGNISSQEDRTSTDSTKWNCHVSYRGKSNPARTYSRSGFRFVQNN